MTKRPPTTEIRIVLRTILSAGVLAVLLLACVGAGDAIEVASGTYVENVDNVKFRGVVTGEPDFGGALGVGGVNVQIDEILSDPTGNLEMWDMVTITWPIVPPFVYIDAAIGGRVEVCGAYRDIGEIPIWWSEVGEHRAGLCASDHLCRRLNQPDPPDKSLFELDFSFIYWFQNARVYAVTDRDVINDMSGVPGWDSVISTNEFNPAGYPRGPSFINTGAESDGLLIREQGHPEVHLILGGEKHHFTSPEALLWNGHSFDDVIDVSAAIIGMFPSGSDISITQAIINKYNDLGGVATFGVPAGTGEQWGYPDSLGVVCSYVNFQNGAIECFTSGDYAGNAYAILNPFFDKWASMGYGKSVLGYPISDMSDVQTSSFGTPSRYQKFINGTERGSLEHNRTSGEVFKIYGAIYAKWEEKEFSSGVLGLVTGDEKEAGISPYGTTGRYSEFENGHIHWISDIGDDNAGKIYRGKAFATYGDLDRLYTKEGGTNGKLGFPVIDKYETTTYGHGDCVFEGGKIVWDNRMGRHAVVYYLPDLNITDIWFSNNNPSEGEPVTIKAAIKNIGKGIAEGNGRIIFSQVSDSNEFSFCYVDRNIFLKHGESDIVETTWNAAPIYRQNLQDGSIKVAIEFDTNDEVNEADSWNNEMYGNVVITSRSNYKPEIDGYHFENQELSSSDKEEIKQNTKNALKGLKFSFLITDYINEYIDIGKGGVCYGMSATSILYDLDYISKPVNKDTFSMDKTEHGVWGNILEYQLLEYLWFIPHTVQILKDYIPFTEISAVDGYKKIEDSINYKPVILGIEMPKSFHAVVPFDIYSVSSTIKNVLVYDPNYPGMARVIQFDLENNKIIDKKYNYTTRDYDEHKYFDVNVVLGAPLHSGDYIGEYVLATAKQILKQIIEALYSSESKLFEFKSPVNITIIDQNGRIINDDGVNNIPNAKFMTIGHIKMFQVPKDLDYIIKIDAYDSGEVTFEQINPLSSDYASIISFTDIPVTENTKGIIEVSSANPEYLMEIDYDGDGTIDEIIKPDVIDTVIIDTTPPATITHLRPTAGTTHIKWTWTNPPDPDFNHTEIYLNDIFHAITSAEHFNATDLTPETSYTISTRTVDTAGNISQTWVNDTATTLTSLLPPSAASSTATGATKDAYRTNEDVYATGSGFTTANADIYLVQDQDWNDGDPIPADVTGSVETVSVSDGNIAPVLVWHAPLTPGRYDIVIDANRNGVYDAHADGLDRGSPGFVVIISPPPTPPTDVPALTPHVILALIGLFCVIGVSRIRRRFN